MPRAQRQEAEGFRPAGPGDAGSGARGKGGRGILAQGGRGRPVMGPSQATPASWQKDRSASRMRPADS